MSPPPPAPPASPAPREQPYEPRVLLRRPIGREDRRAAAGAGIAAAVAAGLITFYLTTLWRARDPR